MLSPLIVKARRKKAHLSLHEEPFRIITPILILIFCSLSSFFRSFFAVLDYFIFVTMVHLGNLLNLNLGLNLTLHLRHDEHGALVRSGAAVLHGHHARGIPSYATNIKRLHHTVKRARSVIENRDTSVAVPETELHNIITKIEDLEKQVKALMKGGEATATSPATSPGTLGSAPTSEKKYGADGSSDQDCDAENLIYDLGARAVVDVNGEVSGHPLFRRNANCPMESAGKGKKKGGKSGKSSGLSTGSDEAGDGAVPGASEPSGTPSLNMGNNVVSLKDPNDSDDVSSAVPSDSVFDEAKGMSSPSVPKEKHVSPFSIHPGMASPTSPKSGSPYSTDDASPNTSDSDDSMDDDASSPEANQKNVIGGKKGTPMLTIDATEVPSGLPPQVVSAIEETIEIKTMPVNGKYITTTITRTTTRRSTVTVTLQHKPTNVAKNEEIDDADAPVPTGFLTTTKNKPNGVSNKDSTATEVSENLPLAPGAAGSFKKFTNGTMKFSNSTADKMVGEIGNQRLASAAFSAKSFNSTLNEKVDAAKATSAPHQKLVNHIPDHTTMAAKAVNTPHHNMVNLTATDINEKVATNTTHQKMVKLVEPGAILNATTHDKVNNATKSLKPSNSASDAQTPNTEGFNTPPVKIHVIDVVPIPANVAPLSSAWTVPTVTATFVTEKPKPFTSASTPANATAPKPLTGFKTVLTPVSVEA